MVMTSDVGPFVWVQNSNADDDETFSFKLLHCIVLPIERVPRQGLQSKSLLRQDKIEL